MTFSNTYASLFSDTYCPGCGKHTSHGEGSLSPAPVRVWHAECLQVVTINGDEFYKRPKAPTANANS